MRHYVLCTEWNESLDSVVAQLFDSFFIVKGIGYWEGTREAGCQIHITTDSPRKRIVTLALRIKQIYAQQAVLVLDYEVNAEYV